MPKLRDEIGRLILIPVAALVMASGMTAHAGPAEDALPRLKEIHRLVMDPSRTFSISETLAELDGFERDLAGTAPDGIARGELNYLRGFILYRAGRTQDSLAPMREALRIDALTSFLPGSERTRALYRLANQAETLKQWPLAIETYRQVLPLFDADQAVTPTQRLGTRERLAFCLHEAKRFTEARQLNQEVLEGGEQLFGPESEKLLVVITNLAQNKYELGDFAGARAILERRLAIAGKHGDEARVEDSLFQLGVLAFEQDQRQEAESFMRRRLALAEKSGNADRIAEAKEDLDILYQKLGR